MSPKGLMTINDGCKPNYVRSTNITRSVNDNGNAAHDICYSRYVCVRYKGEIKSKDAF